MEIAYLADHPEYIGELAQLHFDEWGYLNPGETFQRRIDRLTAECGRLAIPTMVVALNEQELVGSAALVAHDMSDHRSLTPWLASVFVKPAFRRRGVGSMLVRRIEHEATALGIRTLYLFTPSAAPLYERLGWTLLEHCRYKGVEVDIMSRPLPAEMDSAAS